MDIDGFHYEWWYKLSSTDLINLKLTGCIHRGVINICTKFEVIWTKSNFMSNLGFLVNL